MFATACGAWDDCTTLKCLQWNSNNNLWIHCIISDEPQSLYITVTVLPHCEIYNHSISLYY